MIGFWALLFGISFSPAQQNTKLHEFFGGNYNFNMTLYSGLLYGVGARSMTTPSVLASSGVESIYWNPAGIADLSRGEVLIDYSPPLTFQPDKFYDFQQALNREVNSEFQPKAVPGSAYNLPVLVTDFDAGQRLHSFGLAIPWRNFAAGFLWYNPFELKLDLLESGFRALLIEEGGNNTAFRVSGDLNGSFNFYAQSMAFAFAWQIEEQAGMGISLERYDWSALLNSHINFYGSLSIQGGEAVLFNDPSKPYPNSLFTSAQGKMSGSGWGIRLGGYYRPDEQREIAASISIPPRVTMKGKLFIENNTPVFLSGGGIDENRIDPNATTKTKKVEYSASEIKISQPVNISLSYTQKFPGISIIAMAGYFWGDLGYEYANLELDTRDSSRVWRSYRQGIEPAMDLRIGFDMDFLKVTVGSIYAQSFFKSGSGKESSAPLMIPVFSISFSRSISEHFRLDGNIVALSMPFSRLTISYLF